ncbi:MAG: 50S ribosomal protein L32 [Candidatus Paceibacterota bacterium]
MAPLPKRKHSKQRKGKRLATRKKTFLQTVKCKNCGQKTLPHMLCMHCKK